MNDGTQTEDERDLADMAVPIVTRHPGLNTMALTGNINIASKKKKFPTEEVFRAVSSDSRFTTDRDPESGLTRYYLKESP